MKIIVCASVVSFGVCASIFLPTGSAHADLCQYRAAPALLGGGLSLLCHLPIGE
jgi:hypothetical protein